MNFLLPTTADADDFGTHEVDTDEVECIVANLIYSGRIKGYISHQKSILVLSKVDPFPIAAVVTAPSSSAKSTSSAAGISVFNNIHK